MELKGIHSLTLKLYTCLLCSFVYSLGVNSVTIKDSQLCKFTSRQLFL
ncbi:hypothetical protein LDVICp229 [lymphocystis disease virus-China]|uniref:Uncharacterized protein n=1 Tax=lymphocystis disease virus-China TaxID=256729 RepID=Q677N5_9VIRU|nr:hypothetical protein LDVICp229 [lymphocystis disease virus-China]AAU11072.1 hypothetical protein [lymphocystis disease virus-China]